LNAGHQRDLRADPAIVAGCSRFVTPNTLNMTRQIKLKVLFPALCWLFLLGAGHGSWAQVAPRQHTAAHASTTGASVLNSNQRAGIIIGPGDLLELIVYDVPELTLKVRVDSSGMVALPLIGDLELGGLSTRAAQSLIKRKLIESELVNRPEVSLLIAEFATQGISVSGEVVTPGIYPLMGPHLLSDAVTAAGGMTVRAGNEVTVFRSGSGTPPEVVHLPRGTPIEDLNVAIRPGDRIVVSKAPLVYVLGQVQKPGAFVLARDINLTLVQAIAMAGGTTRFAAVRHVVTTMIPSSGISARTPLQQVSLKDIYKGHAADPVLQPDEIIFVPNNTLKEYSDVLLSGAIQAAVAALYLHP